MIGLDDSWVLVCLGLVFLTFIVSQRPSKSLVEQPLILVQGKSRLKIILSKILGQSSRCLSVL